VPTSRERPLAPSRVDSGTDTTQINEHLNGHAREEGAGNGTVWAVTSGTFKSSQDQGRAMPGADKVSLLQHHCHRSTGQSLPAAPQSSGNFGMVHEVKSSVLLCGSAADRSMGSLLASHVTQAAPVCGRA